MGSVLSSPAPLPCARCGRWEVGSDGSLHVTGAQTTDSGLYTCTLSNQHATVGAMATVTITGNDKTDDNFDPSSLS